MNYFVRLAFGITERTFHCICLSLCLKLNLLLLLGFQSVKIDGSREHFRIPELGMELDVV